MQHGDAIFAALSAASAVPPPVGTSQYVYSRKGLPLLHCTYFNCRRVQVGVRGFVCSSTGRSSAAYVDVRRLGTVSGLQGPLPLLRIHFCSFCNHTR